MSPEQPLHTDYRLVHESGMHYSDAALVSLFQARHKVEAEVKKYVTFSPVVWKKLKYFYGLRCKLIHERSAAGVADAELDDFRKLTQKVLKRLFKVKWLTA